MIDLAEMKDATVDPEAETVDGPGRRDLGRAQRRGGGARPRRHRRRDLHDRHRRAHARRRPRLADGQVRARRRQPASRSSSSRRTARSSTSTAESAPRPLLGAARRRRQLRRRDVVHLPPAPADDGHRRADRPPGRRRARAAPLLPRRRARTLPDDLTVFAALVHAPDGSGAKLAAMVGLPHRRSPSEAERDLAPFKDMGLAAHRRGRPHAVSGDEHPARRRVSRRLAQLLALELHRRRSRTG